MVDEDKCIGCSLCVWVCLYGVCEFDFVDGVMKKCMFCVDWIYNEYIFEESCVFVCVVSCLIFVWYFGDLVDLELDVLKFVVECEGFDLVLE